MECICIEIIETGESRRIEQPIWITTNRNGVLVTPHRVKAKGIGDGESIWSLGGLEGCPEAKLITRAEYEESLTLVESDPVLTAMAAMKIMMGGSYETQ